MDLKQKFEEMRPYNDKEVEAVIKRLVQYPELRAVIRFIYSEEDENIVIKKFAAIKTVDEFQTFFSGYAVEQILNKTSDGFSFSGLDNLEKDKPYLFIANHRDIVMDSAIMQWLLKKNGFQTSQITFGSNLMSSPFVIDMGKLNKMFTFYRGGSKIATYRNAVLHSAYIRDVICNQKESLWIAQRDGRTKDGNDTTQASLIKMLLMKQDNIYASLQDLNIVPVVISYEIEPCDAKKIKERYIKEYLNETYVKTDSEDFESVLSGIMSPKGKVHMSFGKPLNQFLSGNSNLGSASIDELADAVCREIDNQVHENFKLYPNNFIAYDMLNANTKYLNVEYTAKDKTQFKRCIEAKMPNENVDIVVFRKMLLDLYAAAVRKSEW